MLRIAVCDDEIRITEEVSNIISDYCTLKSIEFKIFCYDDGYNLLNSGEIFDLIFLDIDMKHFDGIKTAEYIRERDMNVPIVYITCYSDKMRRAFKIHAFEYLVKPVDKNELFNVMDDYMVSIHDVNDELLVLTTNDGVVCFTQNDIFYFMVDSKRKIYVHTTAGKVLVRENLSDIYEKLDKTQFYQTRRDCVMNLKYVQRIQNEFVIIMKNGDMVPLAQKKKEDFLNKLSNSFIEKLKG